MDQALLEKHTPRLYRSLTSDQTATLIQARSGHCRLNQYLARGGLIESTRCECGHDEETVRHVILSRTRWAEARKELRVAAGDRSGDGTFLLGGWGTRKDGKRQSLDGPREKWRSNLEVVEATIRFLEQTGRLANPPQVVEA